MEVYAVTILIISFTSFMSQYFQESNRSRFGSRYFAIITALILIFVSGFRWNVGKDYGNYASAYNFYQDDLWNSIIHFSEPGIRIIASLSEYIYDNYATMFFICSLITVGLFVSTIYKYSTSFFISILLFIFGHGWIESFNGVRQMLASAILFAGQRYIIEREFKKYLVVVILASAFHISAIPMILLYFIPQTKVTLKRALTLLIIVVIGLNFYGLLFTAINFIMNFYGDSLVMTDYITREINTLRILVMMAPPVLYLIITPKDNLDKVENFYINILFLNAVIYMISANSAYLARYGLFTLPYVTMGLPVIFKKSQKDISIMIMFIAVILYSLFWLYDVSTAETLYNFQWIFER